MLGKDQRSLAYVPARAPGTSPIVEEIALSFVVNDDVIYFLPLRALALECLGPRFSVFRNHRPHGHTSLAGFLYSGLGRAVVDPRYRYCVTVRHAGNSVVLPVVFCGELDVSRISSRVDSV